MGDEAGGVVGGNVGVLLAEDQRGRGVLDVVEPALDGKFACGDGEISEGQHGGIGRRRVPDAEGDLGRLAGDLQGIKALGDQFDDAGVIEITPESIVEGLEQRGVLGIAGRGLEIGNREANFFDAEAGTGAHPILSERWGSEQKNKREEGTQPGKKPDAGNWKRRLSMAIVHPFGAVTQGRAKGYCTRQYRTPICSHWQVMNHHSHETGT